jgi:putative transposase
MPWGLKRFQECRQVHFLTFSCYHRRANFENDAARSTFISALERVRVHYQLCVYGYVVMPEHVHLLVNEPQRGALAQALQSLKQGVARRLALRAKDSFWQARYYDFNVWSERKFVEKLRYLHRNPVNRGLVARPEDWPWSSFPHYATGELGVLEIESQWTARRREQAGIFPFLKVRPPAENPRPKPALSEVERAKLGRGTLENENKALGGPAPRCQIYSQYGPEVNHARK